ncbi:MAG: hypothetical protein ACYDBQ_08185 [Thermoplasmatota archaeon]
MRSRGLLALSLVLLASAAALAAVADHDGVGAVADVAAAQAGDHVRWRGALAPWGDSRWSGHVLANHTYRLALGGGWVLVTSPWELPVGEPLLVTGDVMWAGSAPGPLAVVWVESVTTPLLFR